ncbi:MAG: tripartite tricarboxylate transporter substrate binding protein [Hyphomicrobiales bacterium]|nr:tripartite tricarboxylate transporter substrate binding protein [Hyphomicrobiales bacterium]
MSTTLERAPTLRRDGFERWARTCRMTALCAFMGWGSSVAAEDYPSRPLRLVLGFTAGGPTDIPARFLAERLSASLGKPVMVENKPGAGALLAALDVLSRPRDGHDLLLCTYFDAVNTLLYRNAKYKLSDIVGISLIAKYSYAVAVSHSVPAQSFNELIAYTKAHPERINYGHLGAGSTQNLLAKKLEKATGMKMTPIPYKGTPEALQEIVAGRTHLLIAPPLAVMPMYETKQVKVLAVTGNERLASMPEVPTLKESGIPFSAYAWLGVCAGAGIPQPVVDLLNSRIVQVVSSADYRALVEKSGSVAVSSSAPEFRALIEETANDAAPIFREFGVQLD